MEHELDERERHEVAGQLLGPQGLTEKRTTFTETEAVMAWAHAHVQGAPALRVLELASQMQRSEPVVPVAASTPGRPAVFSTADLIRWERAALQLVDRGRGADVPVASTGTVGPSIRQEATPLSEEQAAVVRAVACSPDRVVCVVGRAGSGKTTAIRALADALHEDGIPVLGAAPSGIAADTLAAGTGVPSQTLHRLRIQARTYGGLPRRCVVVVDEAGMADTRTLTHLVGHVERAVGKAVLVGDPAQLPAVGAGGLFAAVVDREGALELTTNRRQRDPLEQRALAALRSGDSLQYLTHIAREGRLVVAADPTEAKARLAADWWQAARDDPAGSAMIAYSRGDVADLNAAAHTIMEREGRLGHRLQLPDGLEVAEGDRVVCLRNDRRLTVTNGTRGTIATVDAAERTAVLAADDGRMLPLPARYLDAGHLDLAYALTGHKTQGFTVEHAFVLTAGEDALSEWGYVALSRARGDTRLYTTKAEIEQDTPPAYRHTRPRPQSAWPKPSPAPPPSGSPPTAVGQPVDRRQPAAAPSYLARPDSSPNVGTRSPSNAPGQLTTCKGREAISTPSASSGAPATEAGYAT